MKRNNIAWLLYGMFTILYCGSLILVFSFPHVAFILLCCGLAGAVSTAYIFGDELRKSVKEKVRV